MLQLLITPEFEKSLDKLSKDFLRISNTASVQNLDEIGGVMIESLGESIMKSFALRADPITGATWPNLQQAYMGSFDSRLRRSNDMFLSIEFRKNVTAHTVAVEAYSDIPYAKVHQYGSSKHPQRRFAGMSKDDHDRMRAKVRAMVIRGR